MDSGSQFHKREFRVERSSRSFRYTLGNYHDINRSPLIGYIRLNITIDNETRNNVTLVIIPDMTMIKPVMLGRDVLKKFGLGLNWKLKR